MKKDGEAARAREQTSEVRKNFADGCHFYVPDPELVSDCVRNVEYAERKYGANSEEATDALRELHRVRNTR